MSFRKQKASLTDFLIVDKRISLVHLLSVKFLNKISIQSSSKTVDTRGFRATEVFHKRIFELLLLSQIWMLCSNCQQKFRQLFEAEYSPSYLFNPKSTGPPQIGSELWSCLIYATQVCSHRFMMVSHVVPTSQTHGYIIETKKTIV